MAYNKHTLIDHQTVITAALLGEMDEGIYQNDQKIAEQAEAINNKASKSDLNSYATKAELANYATKKYVDDAVANAGSSTPPKDTTTIVDTEQKMDEILNNANVEYVGSRYVYTGSKGKYQPGSIYMLTVSVRE